VLCFVLKNISFLKLPILFKFVFTFQDVREKNQTRVRRSGCVPKESRTNASENLPLKSKAQNIKATAAHISFALLRRKTDGGYSASPFYICVGLIPCFLNFVEQTPLNTA